MIFLISSYISFVLWIIQFYDSFVYYIIHIISCKYNYRELLKTIKKIKVNLFCKIILISRKALSMFELIFNLLKYISVWFVILFLNYFSNHFYTRQVNGFIYLVPSCHCVRVMILIFCVCVFVCICVYVCVYVHVQRFHNKM